jgi:hypothetical protein
MGLKWWIEFIAQCLVKLIILVVWFVALFRKAREYPDAVAILTFLTTLDVYLYFRSSEKERKRRPRFFEWFPLGDGFYMAWKARRRGVKRWTI